MVETLEHRRFVEFCDACQRYRYIGLCYGSPGVGKTLSARQYTNWDHVQSYGNLGYRTKALLKEISKSTAVFYTSPVVGSPGILARDIGKCRSILRTAAVERARRYEELKLNRLFRRAEALRDPQINPTGYRSNEAFQMEKTFHEQRERAMRVTAPFRIRLHYLSSMKRID